MRITIGGILLVGGVAAVALLGPWGSPENLLKQAVDGVSSLVKSVSAPAVIPAPAPTLATTSETTPAPVDVSTDTVAVEISTPPVVAVASSAAVVPVEATVEPAKPARPALKTVPAKRLRRRHRRTRRVKAVVEKPPKAAANAAAPAAKPAAGGDDALIGRYVSVKLKSGRDVKGVLRERTKQGLTLEIPGMGPFQYQNSNIDGVKAAE
jgi:hypothetical protein